METVTERLKIKEEQIESLREYNRTLVDQAKSRWQIFQGLMVVLAVLFSIVFAYQVYEATQVTNLADKLEKERELHEDLLDDTIDIFSTYTLALRDLTLAQYNANRARYRDAISDAEMAAEYIENTLIKLDDDSPLRSGAQALLVTCISIQARASYFLKDWRAVDRFATRIIELDPNSWYGHHFRAMYLMVQDPTDERAIECAERSLQLKPRHNPDQFNLLEMYFAAERYEAAALKGNDYLKDYPSYTEAKRKGKLLRTPAVVADLYRLISELIIGKQVEQELREYKELLEESGDDIKQSFEVSLARRWLDKWNVSEKRRKLTPSQNELIVGTMEMIVEKGF
jgi:tetratricopeptide (TPR) repeat protein